MKLELVQYLLCMVNILTPSTGTIQPDISCSFKDDFCGWSVQNSSGVAWEREQYAAGVENSGPKRAYGIDSYYVLFDSTKFNATRGSKSFLVSPVVTNVSNGGCIRFYYHMYGSSMGTLLSGIFVDRKIEKKFSKSGNQGNSWHCKVWSFNSQQNLRIYFEAIRGEDLYSVIALDDITLFTVFNKCSECSDLINTSITSNTTSSLFLTTESSDISSIKTTDTLTAKNELTDTTMVLIIVGGVLVVALIGTIILAVALGIRRRNLSEQQRIDNDFQCARNNQPRPSISQSEKYSDFPNQNGPYEMLQKENNLYDYIDGKDIPPLPPRPPSIADLKQNTIQSLASISGSISPNLGMSEEDSEYITPI